MNNDKRYKISKELKKSIEKVFTLPEIGFAPEHGYLALGYDTMGLEDIGLSSMKPLKENIDFADGIALLRRELEDFVELNALQVDEFEGEGLHRIAYETRATLLVLRDINYYFPNIPTASREELELFRKNH